MPAPDRVGQLQNFNNVINPLKGIVGHYSDVEVDALLAGLGGGTAPTVDLSAYATTAYVDGELQKVYDKAAVDAAIAAAVAGIAFPDFTGLATEQFVADAISAITSPAGGDLSIIKHDEELPQVGPGVTPLQVIAAWASYEPGVHLFSGGPGSPRNLVLLAKSSMTGTTNTPEGEKPTASESLIATVFINGTGTTYIRITTTAIGGVQGNANSEIVAHMGGQWAKMTSTKGDVPFGAPQVSDVFGGAISPELAGLATEKFVADSIAASLSAIGIGESGTPLAPSNPSGGTREAVTEEQVRTIVAESAMTEAEVTRIARTLMTGGKEPPPDRPWGATVLANTSLGAVGLVECRLRNGQITLRGELSYTTSATGSFTNVRSLPLGFPRPDVEYSGVIIGKENGVTFRAVAYKIQTDGMISICPIGGKITHTTFDGATAYV